MESSFQFSNPTLKYLEFGLNDKFDCQQNREVKIGIKLSIHVNRKIEANDAEVELELHLGEKGMDAPFYVSAKEAASFRWEPDMNEEFVDSLLKLNAPSLLISYLRPIIAQVTAATPYNAYNIPFINFMDNEE